jgi:hypothetical protein
MDKSAIGLEQGGQLVLDKPVFNKKGWFEKCRLRLATDDFNAVTGVDNALFEEMSPDFFTAPSNNRKSWEGEKSWRALEDEYRIEASASETGHVTLKATVNLH